MQISGSMSKGLRKSAALLLLGAASCQREPEPVHKPNAPDMGEVVAAYAEPTAAFTEENAAEVADKVTALAEKLARLGLTEQLIDTIQTTLDERFEQTQGSSSDELISSESDARLGKLQQRASKGDAYLLVTRICGGFTDTPTPDREANGAITLTVGLSGDSVDPVIWGAFHACKSRLSGVDVLLTGQSDAPGTFNAYAGEQLDIGNFALTKVLFQLSLWAEVDGVGEEVEVDFQLDVETLELDFRVPVEGGFVLAHADTSLLGVRATNGDFTCDALARRCESDEETIEF